MLLFYFRFLLFFSIFVFYCFYLRFLSCSFLSPFSFLFFSLRFYSVNFVVFFVDVYVTLFFPFLCVCCCLYLSIFIVCFSNFIHLLFYAAIHFFIRMRFSSPFILKSLLFIIVIAITIILIILSLLLLPLRSSFLLLIS